MEIDAVIEDPRGSTVRHFWNADQQRWIVKPHPRSIEPWPANYGYIPGTLNPADGDDLDILVLARAPLETGSKIRVRAVGILERPDGDDKALGVLLDDPDFGWITSFEDVPAAQIEAIEQWFAEWSEVGQWHNEATARQRIQQAQSGAR